MRRFSGKQHVLLALLLLVCIIPAIGQETTGTVIGRVTDPSGAAVPNCQVELSGGTLSKGVVVTTSVSGEYKFSSIPPGTGYKIRATATGFRTAGNTNVAVAIGTATSLDIRLEVGQATDAVSVSADAIMVDTGSSSSAVTVDKSFFDILPKGRSFYDLIGIAPGARNEGLTGGVQVDGASGAENTFFINGMEMESIQGGQLGGQNQVPTEMIQQVEVKNGIMEAQYGGAMGGVVNAVMRSGSNEVHGEAGFYWGGDVLTARPRPLLELDPLNDSNMKYAQFAKDGYNDWNPVFTLSAPIWKNKLFVFAGYMPQLNYTDRTVNFTTGRPGTSTMSFKKKSIKGGLTIIPVSKIRANMSWIFNPNKTVGGLPSQAGTDSYTNNWSTQGSFTGGNTLAGQFDYLATSKLILSFRGGYNYNNSNNLYATPTTTAIYYSGASTTVPPPSLQAPNGWINQAIAANTYDVNTRNNYAADASYVVNWHGQHTLKGGWQYNGLYNDVLNSSYANGYY